MVQNPLSRICEIGQNVRETLTTFVHYIAPSSLNWPSSKPSSRTSSILSIITSVIFITVVIFFFHNKLMKKHIADEEGGSYDDSNEVVELINQANNFEDNPPPQIRIDDYDLMQTI